MALTDATSDEPDKTIWQRLIIYQTERFPCLRFGIMVCTFAFSGLCLSALLRGAQPLPSPEAFFVAAVVTFLFFLQLRVADEFKDHEFDCKFQPYRPVPRGLVALSELRTLALIAAIVQCAVIAWFSTALIAPLLATWLYMGLMTKEFFVPTWLRSHPIAYLGSHMFVMVFIDIFITACDWLKQGAPPPAGIYTFLCVSVCNGLIIEFGRKMRAPESEEEGVETYTALWGVTTGSYVWLTMLVVSYLFAVFTASMINFSAVVAGILAIIGALAWQTGISFAKLPNKKLSERIENLSGLWIISTYACIGALPAIVESLH